MTVYVITFTNGANSPPIAVGEVARFSISPEDDVLGTVTALTGTQTAGTLTGDFGSAPVLPSRPIIERDAGGWAATMTSFEEAAGPVSGTVAATLDPSTLAASGTTTVTGTVAATLAPSTLAASGTTTITGTLAVTLADSTLASSGDVESGSTGTLAVTLDPSTLAASGDAGAPPQDDHNPGGGSRTFVGLPVKPPRPKKIDEELEAMLVSLLLLT